MERVVLLMAIFVAIIIAYILWTNHQEKKEYGL